MTSKEINKSKLNETELEQVSGGEQSFLTVHPDPRWRAECPQCGYVRYVFYKSDLSFCPDCKVPMEFR
ncbi:MAG: bacteriocin [Clostridia bacterium]|nr:bacteriocin [Clostridia bacterium]